MPWLTVVLVIVVVVDSGGGETFLSPNTWGLS
jgi:hypothetical protein